MSSRLFVVGWVAVAAASLALAGCGGAASNRAPFVMLGATDAGGWPILGGGPQGLTVRFIERTRFGIGVRLRNRSRQRVTVVDVRVFEPPRTLVHQVGTRLVPWNPPVCSGSHSCPVTTFFRPSYGGRRPTPVTVPPKLAVGVQLNFRLGSCRAVPFASRAAPRLIAVDYRSGHGRLRHQTLALGSARPRLRMPQPGDCARRPHSHIAVSGAYATSSDWTIPGSNGDSCRHTAAGWLHFRREYLFPRRPAVRVVIRIPHFGGPGLYYSAQVAVVVGIGLHGWTVFRAEQSLVSVKRAGPTTFGGRFRATLVDRNGRPFRAYGAWRCTTRFA